MESREESEIDQVEEFRKEGTGEGVSQISAQSRVQMAPGEGVDFEWHSREGWCQA